MKSIEHKPNTLMWATASFGDSADMSPQEMSELSTHLSRCRVGVKRSLLHCTVQSLREFVAAHFVTTITAVAAFALIFRLWR